MLNKLRDVYYAFILGPGKHCAHKRTAYDWQGSYCMHAHSMCVCEFFGYICGNKNLCLLFSFKFGSASQ